MERRQFLKAAGCAGLCSCTVASLFASDTAPAAEPAPAKEDWRIAFAKQRYSKLLTLVAAKVDADTFRQIVQDVGAFCSESGFSSKFAGNLEGYLAEMQKRWGAQTAYEPASQTAQVSFQPETRDCACPLMGKGLVPAAACHCSVGAMQHSFAVVMGRPVTVELRESLLQGGQRCAFAIRPRTAAAS